MSGEWPHVGTGKSIVAWRAQFATLDERMEALWASVLDPRFVELGVNGGIHWEIA